MSLHLWAWSWFLSLCKSRHAVVALSMLVLRRLMQFRCNTQMEVFKMSPFALALIGILSGLAVGLAWSLYSFDSYKNTRRTIICTLIGFACSVVLMAYI